MTHRLGPLRSRHHRLPLLGMSQFIIADTHQQIDVREGPFGLFQGTGVSKVKEIVDLWKGRVEGK